MAEAASKVPPGMHNTHKQDYLAQAERHIALAQDRIAWQKRIIDELAQAGQETDCAVRQIRGRQLRRVCSARTFPPSTTMTTFRRNVVRFHSRNAACPKARTRWRGFSSIGQCQAADGWRAQGNY